jgi:enoyl-CoA hydratase/carnithine racemase
MTGSVRYELHGPVAWVVIDRVTSRNALSASIRSGLWEATHRFNADDDAKVLVLTGAGEKAFCAGGDLKEMAETELRSLP